MSFPFFWNSHKKIPFSFSKILRSSAPRKVKDLEKVLLGENFWKDKAKVKRTVKEKKIFEDILSSYKSILLEFNNLKDLKDLALEEKNEEILKDCDLKRRQSLELKTIPKS